MKERKKERSYHASFHLIKFNLKKKKLCFIITNISAFIKTKKKKQKKILKINSHSLSQTLFLINGDTNITPSPLTNNIEILRFVG